MEIWKDIKGYNDIYKVSSLGNIKLSEREVPHWRGGVSIRKSKIIKNFKTKSGYLIVPLTKDGKEIKFLVHRIVAEAFIPNPENKPQINHINGNKTDNQVENLEWATRSENIKHADKNNLRILKGVNNSGSKLTEKEVLEIRSIGKSKTLNELSITYNVTFQCISKILNRITWTHI